MAKHASVAECTRSAYNLDQRAAQHWRFVDGWIPMPTYRMTCPDCGSDKFIYSSVQTVYGHAQVNAHFKCQRCNHYLSKTIPYGPDKQSKLDQEFPDADKITYSQLLGYFDFVRGE